MLFSSATPRIRFATSPRPLWPRLYQADPARLRQRFYLQSFILISTLGLAALTLRLRVEAIRDFLGTLLAPHEAFLISGGLVTLITLLGLAHLYALWAERKVEIYHDRLTLVRGKGTPQIIYYSEIKSIILMSDRHGDLLTIHLKTPFLETSIAWGQNLAPLWNDLETFLEKGLPLTRYRLASALHWGFLFLIFFIWLTLGMVWFL